MELRIGSARRTLSIPWRAKIKAFGTHLALSVLLFTGIVVLVIELWYPTPFFWIDGGLQITLLAAFVDIFLGPLLTFVVYQPKRPKLALNLAVIAVVQIAALSWGVNVLYRERPILAAFVGWPQNRFFPITEAQVENSPRPIVELLQLSNERPPYVYVEMPADPLESRNLQVAAMGGDVSVLRQTERYRRIGGDALLQVNKGSRTRQTYERDDPSFASAIDEFVSARGDNPQDIALIPLYGRFGRALLGFSKTDGHLIGVVAKQVRLR